MNISAPFIERPIATTLLTIAIALAGGVGYVLLPVSPLPQVEFPTIQVSAGLPGASPETMASSVATPLERQFGRIAGLTEMTSASQLGSTQVVLQFDLSRDIDGAARDVQAAINAARSQLPANLPGNPSYRKVNPADAPIMMLALTSDLVSRAKMYDLASSVLQQRIAQVDGVGQVFVGGGALPAVRVEVNPTALNARGLGFEDLRAFLRSANANTPKGQLGSGARSWSLASTDQLYNASAYQPLVISYNNGGAVRLQDVADVVDSVEDVRTGGYANGKPAVLIIVSREPGANIIAAVDGIRALLPTLQASVPPTTTLSVLSDRTTTIRASVHDVQITMLISIALVVLVVFVFLQNVRYTIIPAVVVPVSLIGTLAVMYLCGYSLDNLSLMALTIATGFVVDDAIVVIENISRHLERGVSPLQASLLGAKEIGFTVISISLSLVAVFIPILLMSGIVGRLFREFAVTLSIAIIVSLAVSLTTTPMMCAFLLGPRRRADGSAASERRDLFDVDTRLVRTLADRCASTPGRDTRRDARDDACDRLPLHPDSQGLLPAAGHRGGHGIDPVRPGHFVPGDAAACSTVRRHRHARPWRGDCARVRRWRRRPELGTDVRQPEASRRAGCRCDRDHQPASPPADRRARGGAVSPGRPGSAHRRALQLGPVPVHPSKRRRGCAERLGSAPVRPSAPAAGAHRREQRFADARASGVSFDRSAHGIAPGHHAAGNRRHALRRIRSAPGVDDVHRTESVPRRHGSRAVVLAEPGRPWSHLPAGEYLAARCR